MEKNAMITDNQMTEKLNRLLSDYQIFYQNLRGLHWLVNGPQFFQLHKMYESYYNEAAEVVDELAERIIMVGGKPLHTYSSYLSNATLEVVEDVSDPLQGIENLLQNSHYLLGEFREIIKYASSIDDEGTVALMSDLILTTEKRIWMLQSLK